MSAINPNDLSEFSWWCAHLGIGPEYLLKVIEKVGTDTAAITNYLEKYGQGKQQSKAPFPKNTYT